MSPEQAKREALDLRMDLFFFGAVLYELASGHRPFEIGTTALIDDAILKHPLHSQLRLNPALSSDLN